MFSRMFKFLFPYNESKKGSKCSKVPKNEHHKSVKKAVMCLMYHNPSPRTSYDGFKEQLPFNH